MSFSTTNSSLLADNFRSAGQVTVAFIAVYGSTFGLILARKMTVSRQEAKFNRYTSPGMQVVDRLQANFLEWSPIFLGLLWTLATAGVLQGTTLRAAWTYVGLRALYLGLILRHGVAKTGRNKALWPSTFPAYACLLYMMIQAIRTLYF